MPRTANRPARPASALPFEFAPPPGSALTSTGLVLPEALGFDEWERLGDSLVGLERTVAWWIGDWWAFGDHEYGARAKAAAESRFEYEYLANLGWVARAVDPSRRREDLSLGHHQSVASLPAARQIDWLERAAANRLSVRALRRALKHDLVVPPGSDNAPPLSDDEADSQFGQIYELGPHRLLCGDATEPTLLASLRDEPAMMIWTDPPYGVDYTGRTADALTISNDGAEGLPDLLARAWAAANQLLAPNAAVYIAGPTGNNAVAFTESFAAADWRHKQTIIWVKNSMVLGRQDYHSRHEAIYYGSAGSEPVGRRLGALDTLWYGGDNQEDVLFVDRPAASRDHPTMKPVGVIIPGILNSSMPGELILDPFAGSGSTMIAAQLTGRRAVMVELDPRYCDVIRQRWRDFEDAQESTSN